MIVAGSDMAMNMNHGSARILNALRNVIDPEYGYNVVDMGLIYRIESHAEKAKVIMTLPAHDYPSQSYILMGTKKCIQQLPEIDDIEIQLVWDPPWSPKRMTSRRAYVEFPDDHLWSHGE